MGRFTVYDTALVDVSIESQVGLICEIIREEIPEVISVVLVGGFGRGEGSVEVTPDRQVIPLKDYDLAIVVKRIPEKKTIDRTYDRIYEAIKTASPENSLFRFSRFAVDLEFRNEETLISCDIWDYEFREASRLLYGKDLRGFFRLSARDVPLSSGLKLLFEKTTGLIGHLRHEHLRSGCLSEYSRKAIIYECTKTYVEICTALCILTGHYCPSYRGRVELFEKAWNNELSDLAARLPHLLPMVKSATEFKLKPNFDDVQEDPIDLWFRTREDLGEVMKYYIEEFLKISVHDWVHFSRTALLQMWRNYTIPRTRYYLRRRYGIRNSLLVRFADIAAQAFLNSRYAIGIFRARRRASPRQFFSACSPAAKLLLAAIFVLFSINRDGSTRSDYLKQVRMTLQYCVPLRSTFPNDWSDCRQQYLEAHRLYKGPR